MYRTKKDVDKHVENLISRLSVKEFKTRAYSVARLYFDVGDYASCQRYVEQYLSQKDNNAAAHKLLGQALQKLGQKERALEQYKISLDIDPTQTSTILDICDLLADEETGIDPGRAKYWCEKAEATFPRHPITFRLRERLVTMSNPDPEALIKLLVAELAARPKDVQLHARLLKHYLHSNKIQEAFKHASNVEFGGNTFSNSYGWYETLIETLKPNPVNIKEWEFQLLLLTAREHICVLSLTETPSGSSRSLIETSELLHAYDQAIETVAKAGVPPGHAEFHKGLLQHHRGQFVFHAATFVLKKAKKDQISWRDATKVAAPLMLMSWQTVPLDTKVNWLSHAPDKQQVAVHRWYLEGTYRCSQSGHYLLANIQDKSQSFLDRISQTCSGNNWKNKIFEKMYTSKEHLANIKTSHFMSDSCVAPVLCLPRKIEVEAYDVDAQREYANSLHHFVWTILNYKKFEHFRCTLFDMLTPTTTNCGPETLNKLDIHAFLYCAALSSRQHKPNEIYVSSDRPLLLPANITDLLCSLAQMKWWDCAYKLSQNELGSELTDIRATLSRGIEIVRCVDNHGLDPELLCSLGKIFGERAKQTTAIEEKSNLETRAGLYYSSAIPMLLKLKNKITIKMPEKRLFDYTHKELSPKELNSLIEESKLYVAINHYNDGEYEKTIESLSDVKSAEAYYYLSLTYKKIAHEVHNTSKDNNTSVTKTKLASLMSKAKNYAYKALDSVKETNEGKNNPLYPEILSLMEDIETNIHKIDLDITDNNDIEGKYSSSDEYISIRGTENSQRNNHIFRNLSSTPKQSSNHNATNYRTALDSQFETTRSQNVDPQFMERLENQMKNFQNRLAQDFMDQTKSWFEDNRRLGNQIMSTLQSDIQNTTDQFKLLKISVDQIKDQVDECRSECKDVEDIKKQVAELKREVNKLKKISAETIDENELYNLEEEYRSSEGASSFAAQMPFQSPQMMPPFNQRLVPPPFPVPPNPYQIYNQSLFNLYNQYSQFAQTPSVGGTSPLFDPTRNPMNYPGVYPSADQMYLDVAHLVPPAMSVASAIPTPLAPPVPNIPAVPIVPAVSVPPPVIPASTTKILPAAEVKNTPRSSLPVNVVITSSDPLPTCTTAPTPILSVKIPPQHIKGSPHNYQIQLPSSIENKNMSTPPVFSFPAMENKAVTNPSSVINWSTSRTLNTSQSGSVASYFSIPTDITKNAKDGAISSSPNTSLNKSRTLSEKSNTSIENYDPCPDFKPIIPLPAEVKVTTGEEDEIVEFSARAKLYRFVDKQWKERGIGEMKLLKHKVTGKVRVLMRREQVHKICANHVIVPEMEIQQMKNEAKAYIWVANDFADESVVLEKFCVRFKTAELALQFYKTFEKARLESKDMITPKSTPRVDVNKEERIPKPTHQSTPVKSTDVPQQTKTQFGGFTFSSTPTFKAVGEESKIEAKPAEVASSKVNVFSGLSFKTTTSSSPFSSVFSTPSAPVANAGSPIVKQETSTHNTSDTVEEFEPNVEFTPVVPLPALVEQKTGEEEENTLFDHRAKLFRFVTASKEWKERGIGNMKLLVHKENNQKLRLLMRREQVMKVCCNHSVTKEISFKKMLNNDKAVTWCAKDFSEGELVTETFCLRFKTAEACNDFMEALKIAQSKLKDESNAAKDDQNVAKQSSQIGFGDKFKPKPGSWHCDACYTNNLESFENCGCCETPRNKPETKAQQKTDKPNTNSPAPLSGWGDKFKPKTGSWECPACLVRNDGSLESCSACDTPKDPNAVKKQPALVQDNAPKFSFGIPAQAANQKKDTPLTTSNSTVPIIGAAQTKFSFGIPSATAASTVENSKPENNPKSIFDGTGAHKFSFGVPANSQTTPVIAFGSQPTTTSIFSGVKPVSNSNEPLNLTPKVSEITKSAKPALLPTPDSISSGAFGCKETTFDFVFKPKSPTKGKSPIKSPKGQEDESDNEYASEDEGNHIHFNPVIPLPDKVEVVTGEENETELYGHRAKLFRFISGEWKERGIGIVKILKHKETNKMRVVMRREQVHKICLNHALTPEIIYTPKDDKTWLFAANDFSEGELHLQQFCLRFKTKEIAAEFKECIDNAREGKTVVKKETDVSGKDSDSDVVFISETHATTDEQKKAADLMLPKDFYTYKTKEPCKGCRGCAEDPAADPVSSISTMKMKNLIENTITTPMRSSGPTFASPANSVYGTPGNFDKSGDTSIFRTPLGSIGANSNSTLTPTGKTPDSDVTNKENTFTPTSIFSGLSSNTSIFGTPESKPKTLLFGGQKESESKSLLFGGQKESVPKSGILAAPKLNSLNISGGEKQPDMTSIFASPSTVKSSGPTKPLFGSGGLSNMFGATSDKKDVSPEVKSIFGAGSEAEKPVNFFSGAAQGSLFGPGSLGNQPKNTSNWTFGANNTLSQDSSKSSLFENASQPPTWSFGAAANQKKLDSNASPETNHNKTTEIVKQSNVTKQDSEEKKETPFQVDNSLSFAALSSGGPGFTTQKNPSFQWEGAGQQLFGQKAGDKSANLSGAGDESGAGADEEYDPHYEPIVPLPDKIVVTTGEEDEEKLFGERAKLYRYDDKTKEWKERGVGEMKILYHSEKKTYRFLLRREQVHKAVLNMLLHIDLELLPMKNSDKAWTWAGRNFAEVPTGEQETLAVRFKYVDTTTAFHDKVVECIRKLQSAAAQEIKEEKESTQKFEEIKPLRQPKVFGESPSTTTAPPKNQVPKANGEANQASDLFKEVHFQEQQQSDEQGDDEDEDYEHDYEHNEDYDYYNEEEDESGQFYACEATAVIQQDGSQDLHDSVRVQVLFDQDAYSPRILLSDSNTGQVLADMLIHTDTQFHMDGNSCTWTEMDYTSNEAVDKTVTLNFPDSDTAIQFYDSCETSKSATFASTDPES